MSMYIIFYLLFIKHTNNFTTKGSLNFFKIYIKIQMYF